MNMGKLKIPLSNVQLELLKLFSSDVPDEDLEVIRQILVRYKAERLMDDADEMWAQKQWDENHIHNLLSTHLRRPTL